MSPAFPFSVPDPLFLQQVSTISTILSYRPRVGTEGQQLFGAHHCQRNTGTSSLSHLKTEMVHKARDETAGLHALPTLARPQHLLSGGQISILCLVLPMPMLGASGLLQHGFLNHAPEGVIPREVKCIM